MAFKYARPPISMIFFICFVSSSYIGATASESLSYVRSSEVGVWHCTLDLHTDMFPALQKMIRPTKFHLDIWMRYMMQKKPASENGKPELKILVFSEPLADSFKIVKENAQNMPHSISIDPQLALHASSKATGEAASNTQQIIAADARNLTVDLKFQVSPITNDALPFASMSSRMLLDPNWATDSGHEYLVTALGGGPGKECSFKPLDLPRRSQQLFQKDLGAESQSIFSDSAATASPHQPQQALEAGSLPFQAVVIAKPIWPMDAANMALIDRHIQHYTMLGFSK